jgi:hypothetical protein
MIPKKKEPGRIAKALNRFLLGNQTPEDKKIYVCKRNLMEFSLPEVSQQLVEEAHCTLATDVPDSPTRLPVNEAQQQIIAKKRELEDENTARRNCYSKRQRSSDFAPGD